MCCCPHPDFFRISNLRPPDNEHCSPRNPAWTFAVGNTLERPADHTTATPEVGIAPVAENCRTFFVERVATSFPSLSRSRTRGSPVGRPMKKKTLAKLVYRRPIVVRRRSTPTKQRECHDASWGQVQVSTSSVRTIPYNRYGKRAYCAVQAKDPQAREDREGVRRRIEHD